jgi:hypothetical protein
MLFLGVDRIENSFPSIVASIRVYGAVAWQRVNQRRYNIETDLREICYEGVDWIVLVVITDQ